MSTTTIDITKTPAVLDDLLSLSQQGTEVIITRGDTPIARLTAIASQPTQEKRVGNLNPGSIWISDDFDAPLPDEFWLGEE